MGFSVFCFILKIYFQVNFVVSSECAMMYFMQRVMTNINLALCLPCPVLSVANVKDRRLSGGPGTSSSPFTSDLLLPYSMTVAF